jgi:hypothetical protein
MENFSTFVLALQLHFLFELCAAEMGKACFGLVGAAPERPSNDTGGFDTPLGELDGDAADFLGRPANQNGLFVLRRSGVFLSGTELA